MAIEYLAHLTYPTMQYRYPTMQYRYPTMQDRYPTMHHFVTEMCTSVHISVTKWCIVGYGTGALWYFDNRSNDLSFLEYSTFSTRTVNETMWINFQWYWRWWSKCYGKSFTETLKENISNLVVSALWLLLAWYQKLLGVVLYLLCLSTSCAISVLINDGKCKYIFVFNLLRPSDTYMQQ